MSRFQKNRRTLMIVVILALAIGCIITAVALWPTKTETESDIKLTGVESSKINLLSLTSNGVTLTFSKSSGQWICREYPDFPLNGGYIDNLAESFSALTAKRRLTADEAAGIDIGQPTVTVTAGYDGGETSVYFCKLNEQTMSYYTRVGGGSVVYLVTNTLADVFNKQLFSLADLKNGTTILSSDVIEINVSVPGAEKLTLYYLKSGNSAIDYTGKHTWFYRRGNGDLKPASTTAAIAVLDAFQNINNERLAAFKATDSEMASFGLTADSCTEVSINYKNSSGANESKITRFAAAGGDMTVANTKGSDSIYYVDLSLVGSLQAAAAADLDPHDTFDIPIEAITGFTVSIGGSSAHYKLTYNESESAYYFQRDGGQKTKADSFVSLYNGLVAALPQRVIGKGYTGAVVATINVETSNTFFKTVMFTIYDYDESFYASIISDGAPLLLNRRTIDPLLEYAAGLVK